MTFALLTILLQVAILDKDAPGPGIVQTVTCKATTDVPELKAGIKAACRPGLVSIDISGDHDTITETLVLDKDLGGRDLSEIVGEADDGSAGMTKATLGGFNAAMESAKIMDKLYHSTTFVWQVRDRKLRPICRFEVSDEETIGKCTDHVEP